MDLILVAATLAREDQFGMVPQAPVIYLNSQHPTKFWGGKGLQNFEMNFYFLSCWTRKSEQQWQMCLNPWSVSVTWWRLLVLGWTFQKLRFANRFNNYFALNGRFVPGMSVGPIVLSQFLDQKRIPWLAIPESQPWALTLMEGTNNYSEKTLAPQNAAMCLQKLKQVV